MVIYDVTDIDSFHNIEDHITEIKRVKIVYLMNVLIILRADLTKRATLLLQFSNAFNLLLFCQIWLHDLHPLKFDIQQAE